MSGYTSAGYVLADGPDPVRNRVLGQGDTLFGRTVSYTNHLGRDSMNSIGQICIDVQFTNGSRAIVRADPRRWASR